MLPLIKLPPTVAEPHLLTSLKDMATNGLRTLVCAHARHDASWWETRAARYAEVIALDSTTANEGHPDKCAHASGGCDKCIQHEYFEKLEREAKMEYLGCIGMEDQ